MADTVIAVCPKCRSKVRASTTGEAWCYCRPSGVRMVPEQHPKEASHAPVA